MHTVTAWSRRLSVDEFAQDGSRKFDLNKAPLYVAGGGEAREIFHHKRENKTVLLAKVKTVLEVISGKLRCFCDSQFTVRWGSGIGTLELDEDKFDWISPIRN